MPSVAMAAKHQVHSVTRLEQVEHVGSMGEQNCETTLDSRRNAADIGTVRGWVIEADDPQLTTHHGDEDCLVDEQVQLVPVGEVRELADWHATEMIMVAESQKDWSYLSEI